MRKMMFVVAAIVAAVASVSAVNVGGAAPDFSLSTGSGGTFNLADQKGKVTVVFFLGCTWGISQAIGPMVEDSIMQKFSAAKVAVVGIDVWNSSDSLIGAYLSLTGVTFPVMRGGAATGSSYGVVANSMVVVDQNGIVQYIRQLGTASTTSAIMSGMVSEAASTVRGLLTNNVLQFSHMGNGAVNKQFVGNSEFTLLGRKAPRRAVSTNLLVSKNGKPRPMPLFHWWRP